MHKLIAALKVALAVLCMVSAGGCMVPGGYPAGPSSRTSPTGAATAERRVDSAQTDRLKRLMIPLLQVMNRPIASGQVQIDVIDDPQINAGSAGSGQFVVTTGLLGKANDVHLESILAHEIAHDDLGHVYKIQTLAAGLDIAAVLLDQLFPGSGQLTPFVGNFAIRAYGRNEEYEADRHGVVLLRRLHPNGKEMMVNTMVWLQQTTGGSGGGFFATHPATSDRIDRIRAIP